MNPFRGLPLRTARITFCGQLLQNLISTRSLASHSSLRCPSPQIISMKSQRLPFPTNHLKARKYGTKTTADEIIEGIQEQYATARDEFEIASEETERKTVYAADDRIAARVELNTLKAMYEEALEGKEGEEVKRRVSQRIRELDNAVEVMEKSLAD